MSPLGNAGSGISIQQNTGSMIGGSTPAARNIISGNHQDGIFITSSNDVNVEGNFIGVAKDGTTAVPNGGNGVHIPLASGNIVGDRAGHAGNVIAYNKNDGVLIGNNGVLIGDSTPDKGILSNSIFGNKHLGIELTNTANLSEPAPTLTSAVSAGGLITVRGTFTGAVYADITIQVFSNPARDPSGFGQGQDFLGSVPVTTDGTGKASFVVTLPTAFLADHFVSATATDLSNYTSSFARTMLIAPYQP